MTLFLCCAVTLTPLHAADITGTWSATFETPIGSMSYTYEFVVKDGKLTGKIQSSMFGDAEVTEGKVDGDKVTFVEMMDGSIRLEYTGKSCPPTRSISAAKWANSRQRHWSPSASRRTSSS